MNVNEIKKLIELVEETGINEIEVTKFGGRKIKVVKNSGFVQAAPATAPVQAVSQASSDPAGKPEADKAADDSKYYAATSPMVGTFYRAPAPEEPAFASIGDTVKKGQTICIIEAMKVMNEIESEVSGTIVDILVENASPVEFSEKLFLIDESK